MALLTPKELCAHLKISRSSLARLQKAGLPGIGSGKLRRFDQNAVLGWYDQHQQQATPAITLLAPGHYRCEQCNFMGTVHVASPAGPCPQCRTWQPLTFLGGLT